MRAASIGPAATTRPARSSSACVVQSGISSTWWVTATVVRGGLLGREPAHGLQEGLASRQVQAGRRLVEEQQERIAHQRARELDALALAARAVGVAPVLELVAAEALEQPGGRRPFLVAARVARGWPPATPAA